ncbi:MAG TPA: cytochrome c biogenesis protein CcdA, partial [Bacteroidales bacterium]|nr:cytochrome c biogenesis protein CcdA [Bacteroidales bacterium]
MKKIGILISTFLVVSLSAFSQFNMQAENPVSWEYSTVDRGNGLYDLVITASIEKPWHMYAIELEQTGPIPTTISFSPNAYVKFIGDIHELTKPVVKFDEGFKFDVGAYYNSAEFRQEVKVLSAGPVNLNGEIEYQCCNDETCLPPFQEKFSFSLPGNPAAVTRPKQEKAVADVKVEDEPSGMNNGEDQVVVEVETPDTAVSVETGQEQVAGKQVPEFTRNPVQKEEKSFWLFILISFLAGLAAILTPCVFPMIPMTVSFFMRGSDKKGPAVVKGIVFGLSIVLIYTGLGVLVALTGLDANVGNTLSTHWIPNLIFFALFMVFAASFLGMFEIVLPSGMVNNADKHAERGGLIGPFFMGLTTVLVSFSCTGPIVGTLLIEAAGGAALKPILGMFFFSLAFALPFTILAIFPSMLGNLPKSGGWLNSVKVVLGFMMLAFGMKFLSSMDQAYHLNIFTREVYLSIWFVISVMAGFYLLGKLKLSHDSDLPYISVPRLILAIIFFVFAVYLFTGIFGNNLWAINAMIPPKSEQSFNIGSTTVVSVDQEDTENYCGPGRYSEMFEFPYGIKGY